LAEIILRIDLKKTLIPKNGIAIEIEGYGSLHVNGVPRFSLLKAISNAAFLLDVFPTKEKKVQFCLLKLDYYSDNPGLKIAII